MQRRRCAAMLDHRGCNDDAAHNDHILALITRGTRRTAALSKVQSGGFCVPNGLEIPAKLLAPADEVIE
jgi:hypothetical protein